MKLFASLLLLCTFAVVTPGYAQGTHPEDMDSISGIRRPTPKPGDASATATTTSKPLEVILSKEEKGKSAISTFAPTDTVYVVCQNLNAAKGDKIHVAFVADEAVKTAKGKKIYDATQPVGSSGTYNPTFHLTSSGLAAGKYHVDILLNANLLKSLKFTVK